MIKTDNSNYSVFLLTLLFIEFISNFLRAGSLPNLGIYFRLLIFGYIIFNFLLCVVTDIINGGFRSKICIYAVVFWLYTIVIYCLNTENFSFIDMINLTTWAAVLYLFYYYGFPRTLELLNFISGAFAVIFIFLYYRYDIHGGFVGDKPGIVNGIYNLVMCVPFLLLFKNRIIKVILIAAVTLVTVQSNKATAILMMLFTLMICFIFSGERKKKNFALIAGSAAAFVIVLIVLIRVSRLDLRELIFSNVDTGGNGRFEIWESIFKEYNSGSFFKKLFGYGLNFSVKVTTFSAHCDFFEIITAFGIVGFVLFLRWFVFTGKEMLINMRNRNYYYIALVVFMQTGMIFLLSTSIFVSNYFLLLSAFIGMLSGYHKKTDSPEETKL